MANYSGVWSLEAQLQAVAAGNWTGIPVPNLFSWGYNGYGQLGLGNTTNYSSPKQVGALTTWSTIACGYHTLATKTS